MEYSAHLERAWQFQTSINSPFDQTSFIMDNTQMGYSDFSSLINPDEISDISSYAFGTLASGDNLIQVPSPVDEFPMDIEGLESGFIVDELFDDLFEVSEGSFPSQQGSSQKISSEVNDVWSPDSLVTFEASSMDSTSIQTSTSLPAEEVEIQNESIVCHLLQSFGEAMENDQKELQKELLRCISEKVSPVGHPLERLALNFCQEVVDGHQQGREYIKQESLKNFKAAFNLFYQNFPYGKFAHYVANSAILEAIPADAETIRIVDFDMGEGVQFSQIIEPLAQRFKTLEVIAIQWEESDRDCASPHWRFEEVKKQLQDHARPFGLNLKVETVAMEDLMSEIKRTKKRSGGGEFLAFNCMVSLPHMRRRRSRKHVMEFLRIAKELLANYGNSKTSRRGIVTFADGDACEGLENDTSFSSFFNGNLARYEALLQSMESNFPSHLGEARMVMECIFLAPYVSSQAWLHRWRQMKEDRHIQPWLGMKGRRLSKENVMEATEIVGEEISYAIRLEGKYGNEMALEWNTIPLVRVSAWENQS